IVEMYDSKNNCIWGVLLLEQRDDFIYKSHEQLHTYWLNELSKQASTTFLISDQPVCCNAVLNVTERNAYRILTIHNNHFRSPYKLGAFVNDRYGNVLSAMPHVDAVISLTHKQKEHILLQYKDRDNLYVIGNPVTTFNIDKNIQRDPYLCVAICRLVPMKNIKEMIDIFWDAVLINNKLKLEIWGDGNEKDELQNYVESLGASTHITFKGFTSNPGIIFQRAAMSLATSLFEGFGVSFAESLSLGTPVISYRTLYGPEEIITNGVDGFLVDNRKEFVNKIIELAGNTTLQHHMGKNGIHNMKKFSKESIINKWLSLFNSLEDKGAKINYIENKLAYNDFFYNVTGSAYGWVYVKHSNQMEKYLKNGRDIQVAKVFFNKDFKGEKVEIREGDYQITSLEYIKERGDFRFKLSRDNNVYSGALGMRCLKMSLV
ncbi:glycosyltransferase, partial [Escherichia marmotae]|nr:glycosyltransferase [Escherichia marmotae]